MEGYSIQTTQNIALPDGVSAPETRFLDEFEEVGATSQKEEMASNSSSRGMLAETGAG
jgi:hypothetical protein